MTIGLRVSDKDEDEGLDESEHGALAYPELLRWIPQLQRKL